MNLECYVLTLCILKIRSRSLKKIFFYSFLFLSKNISFDLEIGHACFFFLYIHNSILDFEQILAFLKIYTETHKLVFIQ